MNRSLACFRLTFTWHICLDPFVFAYCWCTHFGVAQSFSVIVSCLFIFGASFWSIFLFMFVKFWGFVATDTNVRSWTWAWHYCLYIGFWLTLIKISLQRFGCVSSAFTVVLGRYRLQRLNHSSAECSFSYLLRTADVTVFLTFSVKRISEKTDLSFVYTFQ